MEHININTERGQRYIRNYQRSRYYSIEQCYKNPSVAKTRASRECVQKMLDEGGTGYKIISFNQMFFTAAWQMKDGEGLRVETTYNSFIID